MILCVGFFSLLLVILLIDWLIAFNVYIQNKMSKRKMKEKRKKSSESLGWDEELMEVIIKSIIV